MKKIVQRLVLFVLLAVLFTACGSGGGGDNGPSPSQGQTPKTDVYLFYRGSLTAVDPASSPTNTIVISVETGTTYGVAPIEHGRYNSGTVSDLHNRTIIYAKGANLYKVSALKGATPTPVQLSSEAGVTSAGICDWYAAPDYADHNNARYLYKLPGADNNCSTAGDNVWKMVKVGMTATDAPITSNVGRPLTELRNMSTGALTGWLMLNGTNLYRHNADFGSPTLVAANIIAANVAALAPSGKVFLRLVKHGVVYINETFDSGQPAGWTVVDNLSTGATWTFNDPGMRGNLTGGTGGFAIADSDYAGTVDMDTELRSPAIDLTGATTAFLEFKTDVNIFSGAEIADADVSINSGSTWTNVWRKTGADYRGPETETVDITALAAGQANVKIRFHYYNANYDWWWQVDDFLVTTAVEDDLKLYNPADNTLSSSLHAFSGGFIGAVRDGSNLYFLDGNREIYKVSLDGSSAAASFYSASGNTVFDGVMLTANRVVTTATDTVTSVPSIVTIPVSSGTATTVKTGASGDMLMPLATAGSRIYYFSLADGSGTVSEDGSGKTEYVNGLWSGTISPASRTLGQHETVSSMVLSDLTATPELRVYDAATFVVTANTGTLPAGVSYIGFSGLANGGSILGNSDTDDIFLINTRTDNSLVRITNTPGTESVVGGGCIYNPMARFDPLFAVLLLSPIVHLLKRRYARRH